MLTAGHPIAFGFDVKESTAVYSFFATSITNDFNREGLPVASLFLPLEMHYPKGFKIEVEPRQVTYRISPKNDHVLEIFSPKNDTITGLLVAINISPKY